jgi:hypothetical protein
MNEVHSELYPSLAKPIPVNDVESLRLGDPGLFKLWDELVSALSLGLLPVEAQVKLVEAMPSSTQREVVNKIAGFDSSVLMTLKHQLHLVDSVLRRVIDDDGKVKTLDERIDISPKEAINMSIKLTQVITRDLPKMYKVERVQNLEAALFEVVETLLTKDQQDAVLLKLQEKNLEDARRREL